MNNKGQISNHVHVRIDNRLLHGQVVQFWIPHLEVTRLIVADDTVANNEAMPAIYRMAVPENVQLVVTPVSGLCAAIKESPSPPTTLVLISDVFDVTRALMGGSRFSRLTIGNVHAAADRMRITDSVYLSPEEIEALHRLRYGMGLEVEIQTFPGEVLRLVADDKGAARWSRP